MRSPPIIAAFDLLEETPMLEEHGWLPRLSLSRVPLQTGKNCGVSQRSSFRTRGEAGCVLLPACLPVSVAQRPPPPALSLGESLSRASSFLPLASGLTPWMGLLQWVLSQDAWLGQGLVLCRESLSLASPRAGLIWSPFPCHPSDRLLAREIQVFERFLLCLPSVPSRVRGT